MIVVSACLELLILFADVFLVARVFVITDYNIFSVALFLLADVIAVFFFFAVSSFICKKVKAIYVTRASAVFFCAFAVAAIVLESRLSKIYVLLGALWGTVQGLYWGAMNFVTSRVFEKRKVLNFFSSRYIIAAVIGIVFPITFGIVIDFGSWAITSALVLLVGAVQLLFSFFIKMERQSEKKMDYRGFFRGLRAANHTAATVKLWFVCALTSFSYILPALMTILIIYTFGSNFGIGVFGTAFAVFNIIVLTVYRKSPQRVKTPVYFLAGCLPFLVAAALIFNVSMVTIIIFNAVTVMRSVINIEENKTRLNAVHNWGGEKFLLESHLFFESALFVGRVIAISLLFAVYALGATKFLLGIGITLMLFIFAIHAILLFLWRGKYEITDR
jgi:hypothetical protein